MVNLHRLAPHTIYQVIPTKWRPYRDHRLYNVFYPTYTAQLPAAVREAQSAVFISVRGRQKVKRRICSEVTVNSQGNPYSES